MSSSTMIQGATIRRASAYRIAVETTTRPATHAHIGTRRRNARALLTEPDLAQPRREDGRIVAVEPALGRGGGDVAQDVLGDRRAARHLLERGGVRLRDAVEPVLALDELAGLRAHRGANGPVGQRLERGEQEALLAL